MSGSNPVLLIVFNRPEKTRKVVDALLKVQPSILFVAGDGPRLDKSDDFEKCRLVRNIVEGADWKCDLKTRFSEKNLGCYTNVPLAISWFFEEVEQGIIIEDDCIPSPQFFPFCRQLLDRFADDERIMQISGFAPYPVREYPYDYHFSRAFRCWGWGTWRRAWKHYLFSLDSFQKDEMYQILKSYYAQNFRFRYLYNQFAYAKKGEIHNWDYLWNIACYAQSGLCIVPERNLVSNIGFDEESTNTSRFNPVISKLPTQSLQDPLRHPILMYPDNRPEQSFQWALHRSLPLRNRLYRRYQHILGAWIDFFESNP